MVRSLYPPSPVVGLLVAGSILLIIEGVVVAAVSSLAANVLPILGVGIGVAAFIFVLAFLTLWVAVAYLREHSWGLGLFAIILGALSFLVGAGFFLGGLFIIIAGSLAMFWDSVERSAFSSSASNPASIVRSSERDGLLSSSSTPAGSRQSHAEGAREIILYRRCPTCGELYRPGETTCPRCGSPLR